VSAGWEALAGLLVLSWVVFPASVFAAWWWAFRVHTLYRAMLVVLSS